MARLPHVLSHSLLAVLVVAGPLNAAPGAGPGRGPGGGSGTSPAPDLERRLEQLASAEALERHSAQLWLAANLRRADYAAAATAARRGDAEVRRRLGHVLAADARHLGLAVLFLTDPDDEVAEIGRVAIEDLIVLWDAAADEPARAPRSLPQDWVESETRRMAIDLRAGGIGDIVDRIERLAPAPATVVLDPTLDPGVYDGPEGPLLGGAPFEGVWTDLVTEIARVHRVSFEVHSYRAPGRGARPWVRFHGRGGGRGEDTIELLVDWCRGVVREGDRPWNVACARALAATGWPAAIAWFEELWLSDDSEAAREGLLFAAARGRVAPSLADPARLERLLDSVDRELATRAQGAVARAETLALALASVGPLGGDERWTAVLTEGWPGLSATSRWMRLVALEGHGRGDARARRIAFDELARAGRPGLRLQALRSLVSLSARGDRPAAERPEIAEPLELFDAHPTRLDELTQQLTDAGVPFPPGAWHVRVRDPEQLVALLRWSLESDAEAALGMFWRALALAPLGDLSRELRRWCGLARADAVRTLLERARDEAPDEATRSAVERLRLRVGLLDPDEERAALDALLAGPARTRTQLVDLGALCAAQGVGWRAREALVEEVGRTPRLADLEPAVVEALEALARARLDREVDVLSSRLKTAADAVDHPIQDLFYRPDWPPVRPPVPLDLDALDRRVGPGGL